MLQKGGSVDPLGKTRVQISLANVTAECSNMGNQRKFGASLLVMQIEDLLLNNSMESRVVEVKGGLIVSVPNQACLAAELKKRLVTGHEVNAKKIKASL